MPRRRALTAYVDRIDLARMILIGAVERFGGALVGLAEAHLDRPRAPSAAEISVSVLRDRRGRGIGTQIVAEAVASVFALGVEQLDLHFMPGNRALLGLLGKLDGAQVDLLQGRARIGRPLPLVA